MSWDTGSGWIEYGKQMYLFRWLHGFVWGRQLGGHTHWVVGCVPKLSELKLLEGLASSRYIQFSAHSLQPTLKNARFFTVDEAYKCHVCEVAPTEVLRLDHEVSAFTCPLGSPPTVSKAPWADMPVRTRNQRRRTPRIHNFGAKRPCLCMHTSSSGPCVTTHRL